MAKIRQPIDGTKAVDEYLEALNHPYKAEVEVVRRTIMGVDDGIAEQIKWNAPSFRYRDTDFVTFNLRAQNRIHLVFHHPAIVNVNSPILEGEYKDRRMVYLANREDVRAKQPELERVIRELTGLMGE